MEEYEPLGVSSSKESKMEPVKFEVQRIENGDAPGYAKISVKFFDSDKTYTYFRKAYTDKLDPLTAAVVIDGCEVKYDKVMKSTVSVKRLYDTAGKKKTKTKAGSRNARIDSSKDGQMAADLLGSASLFEEVDADAEVKHAKYDAIKTCLKCGIPVYLAGPAGSGKNFTVEQIAEELGWEFHFSNSIQQEYKLTGFIDAAGDYHETEFYRACTSDKQTVFFLDEMDASIPEVLVLLNAAIANGYFEFPTGRVDLKGVHFVAAGNTVGSGADELYTGRMVIDQATLDRFAIIEFGYDKRVEMKLAENDSDLVDFVESLRASADAQGVRATFSYRCISMAKKLDNAGMALEEVLKIAVVKGLDKDTINTIFPNTSNPANRFMKAYKRLRAA